MVHDVTMPQLGMTQDSGIILSWLKSVGDPVNIGDVLMEVETDKAVVEVEAAHHGFLREIRAKAGSDIPVGETVGIISRNADDVIATPMAQTQYCKPEPIDIANRQVKVEVKRAGRKILASPKAKTMAKERGIELTELVQRGIDQPVHYKDVVDFKPIKLSPETSPVFHLNEITFTILRSTIDQFIDRLNQQSNKNLQAKNLWVKFACGALRSAMSYDRDRDLYCKFSTADMTSFKSVNADQFLLSAQNEVDDTRQIDVSIYDYSATNITDFNLVHDSGYMSVYITAKSKKKLKIKVAASDQILTTDQMFIFISELNARLNNPLGFIV